MFINRDENNKMIAMFACQQFDGQEYIDDNSEEILIFEGKIMTLEQLKSQKHAENFQKREERFAQGAMINGHKLDINTEAKTNFIGLVISGIESLEYMDFNSESFIITKEEFPLYVQGFMSMTKAIYDKDKQIKDAIDVAHTKEELDVIDINYGEI